MQGKITALQFVFDVPDITEALSAVAIAVGGTRLPITKTYRQIKAVGLNLRSDGTAVSAAAASPLAADGPIVHAVGPGGAGVAATVDATVQGF